MQWTLGLFIIMISRKGGGPEIRFPANPSAEDIIIRKDYKYLRYLVQEDIS